MRNLCPPPSNEWIGRASRRRCEEIHVIKAVTLLRLPLEKTNFDSETVTDNGIKKLGYTEGNNEI